MPKQSNADHAAGAGRDHASGSAGRPAAVASALTIAAAAVAVAIGIAAPAGAQPASGGAFLEAQAASGRTAYGRSCAACHGATLRGAAHGPELTGRGFLNNWGSSTAGELLDYVRIEMPPGLGGSLTSDTYLNIVAYLLQENGHAAGAEALTADAGAVVGETRGSSRPAHRLARSRMRRLRPTPMRRKTQRSWSFPEASSTGRSPASRPSPTRCSGIRRPRTG